ncbi:unnamed protein product [Amoebophrya sp. A25]|nr:unnamed protein product [Amoebophrya sp. A25]|eukprot:GSA25T00017639001.1
MFTGVFLFGGFIFFSIYRRWVTYNLNVTGRYWTAYYIWFYLFLLGLFFVDLQHVYQYEICDFDWLRASDKFSISLLPADEQERYFLPNWLRIMSLCTPFFVIATFLVSLVHTVQHHWHIDTVLAKRQRAAETGVLSQSLKQYLELYGFRSGAAEKGSGPASLFSYTVSASHGGHSAPTSQATAIAESPKVGPALATNSSAPDTNATLVEEDKPSFFSSLFIPKDEEHIKDPFLEAIFPHDLSIQVIALPCVYSMMAFKSVVRVWMLMTGSTHNTNAADIESRKKQLVDYYESNYQLADLYEAWAIWCFSRLCVRQVKNVSRQERWEGTAKRLFKPLSSITLLGVQTFVLVYGLSCFYQLVVSLVKKTVGLNVTQLPVVGEAMASVGTYISGAGFVASCLALYNIILFETQLHEWLDRFDPFWKFWGAKVLVSLAFLQTFVLKLVLVDALHWLTEPQQMLFYSTLTTMECLPIALLHMRAWDHNAEWFADPEWMLGSLDASLAGTPREATTAEREARAKIALFRSSPPPGKDMAGALEKPLLVTVPAS